MQERRFKPPKPEDITARTTGFIRKLETNRKSGEERLLSEDFVPFRGFDKETFSNIYTFTMELSQDSQAEIMDRVVEPLRTIAQHNGIEAVFPNYDDILPHITFDAARFVGLDPNEKQHLETTLDHDIYLNMIARILSGLNFSMDTLVIAPNSYICAGEFSSELYPLERARRLIEKVFGKNPTLSTIDYRDILHSSVARITKIPEDKTYLRKFRDEAAEKVGNPLQSAPVSVSVSRAFPGISIDFIENNGGLIANGY